MLSFLAVLLPFFPIILCDVFTRDDCWCRNATHLGWKRHFELDGVNIEGDPLIMDQWCFQATHDGRGKCLDWHTIQYRVCASHQAAHNASRRNDFCYYNHGNFRGAVTLWSKGDDAIKWNDHIRNVPFKSPPVPMSVEESIRYCEPVCRDFHGWNLRVMDPWSPSKHGVVESRHQVFNDITDFPFEDGVAGEWPYKSPTHKSPGEFSTTQNGIIDYWVIDFEHEGSGLDPIGHGGSLSWKHAKETLAALSDLQCQPLSIIRLSEPISNPFNPNSTHARTSDISTSGLSDDSTNPTPASLAADLSHYRDLFSKLRFSYLEQVTKEKFLRAIVGDPPLIIENAENVELESQLKEVKVVLKEQKEHVARMVQELERKGRALAGRYEQVALQTELLGHLPEEIQGLEARIRKLREDNKGNMDGMGGGLGLDKVVELTRDKERQREEVERELKALQREMPGKGRELERLADELKGLEREKEKAVEGAREAVKSRKSGGAVGDGLETRGRWLKGCDEGLRGLLGVGA